VLIGEASVRIDALTADLKKQVDRDLNDALKGIKIDSDPLVKMTTDLRRAELDLVKAETNLAAAHRTMEAAETKVTDTRRKFGTTSKEAVVAERELQRAHLDLGFAESTLIERTRTLTAAHVAHRQAVDDNHRSLGKLLLSLVPAAAGYAQLGLKVAGVGGLLLASTNLIVAAVAGVVALTGATGLAVPALFSFAGVLAAVKLGADGIKKAFAGLTPTVNAVKTAVSGTFEKTLIPAVTNLKGLLPQLTAGLQGIAGAISDVITKFTGILSSSTGVRQLNVILTGTAGLTRDWGGALATIVGAFLNVAATVMPILLRLSGGIGGVADRFAAWIDKIAASGQLAGWVERGVTAFRQLFGAVGQIVGVFVNVYEVLRQAGFGLQMFADIAQFARDNVAWVAPLVGIFLGVAAAVKIVEAATKAWTIVTVAAEAAQWLLNAAMDANPVGLIVLAIAALVAIIIVVVTNLDWFKGRWDDIWKFCSDVITSVVGALRSAWTSTIVWLSGVVTSIGGFFTKIGGWFAALPGRIGSFLASLPGVIGNALLTALKAGLNAVVQGVEWIIAEILVLPLQIEWVIRRFGQLLVDGVTAAYNWVKNITTQFVLDLATYLAELPGKVGLAIAGFGSMIADWATSAWNWVTGIFHTAVNSVVNFVRELPGRIIEGISAFGSMLANWATAAWNWVTNIFHTAVNGVVDFVKELPGRIVAGVAGFGSMIADWATAAWTGAKQAVVTKANEIVDWGRGLPGKIVDSLGNVGNLLSNAGKSIMDGLGSGIKAAAQGVLSFVSGIGSKIVALKGPLDYDKQLLIGAGYAIMDGLHGALVNRFSRVLGFVKTIAPQIAAAVSTTTVNPTITASGGIVAKDGSTVNPHFYDTPPANYVRPQWVTDLITETKANADLHAQAVTDGLSSMAVVMSATATTNAVKRVAGTDSRRR
jgi:phage-related protein